MTIREVTEKDLNGPRHELVAFDGIGVTRDTEYLIKNTLPRHGMGVLYGPPKSFKSFAALDMTLPLALGWPEWRGRKARRNHRLLCW